MLIATYRHPGSIGVHPCKAGELPTLGEGQQQYRLQSDRTTLDLLCALDIGLAALLTATCLKLGAAGDLGWDPSPEYGRPVAMLTVSASIAEKLRPQSAGRFVQNNVFSGWARGVEEQLTDSCCLVQCHRYTQCRGLHNLPRLQIEVEFRHEHEQSCCLWGYDTACVEQVPC